MKQIKSEQDEILEEYMLEQLTEAKKDGLYAVKEWIINSGSSHLLRYRLKELNESTIDAILHGEFNYFEELLIHDANSAITKSGTILYKEIDNKNRVDSARQGSKSFVIDSIFVNYEN